MAPARPFPSRPPANNGRDFAILLAILREILQPNAEVALIHRNRTESAADELLAAALLSEGWEESLQQLADATEAGGASVVRIQASRPAAHLSSTDWAEVETAAMAGGVPPSRLRYYPEHVYGSGFRVDHDVWTDDEMRRDPYFQEFLRPRGVLFHAKLRLWSEPDERAVLTLKRRLGLGPYERSDIAALDSIVPKLRAACRVARRVLDAKASGMVHVLRDWADLVIELGTRGRVLRCHGDDDTAQLGVVVRGKRILATERRAQAGLEQAIAATVKAPQHPAIVPITNQHGERRFLHVIPVTGHARDVFLATVVMVVVIEPGRVKKDPIVDVARQTFGLTEREAQIAALLAEGSSLPTIARRLRLGMGTVRNHVKSIFGKTGTGRQGELVALLCALRL